MTKHYFFLLFSFSAFLINAQVVVDTVFTTTEEIAFVSEDGNGLYTVSGNGTGENGFLAIYDEENDRWEDKIFPPNRSYGDTWNAVTKYAYTHNGVTIAGGDVALSTISAWGVIRKYNHSEQNYAREIIYKNTAIRILPPIDGEYYGLLEVHTTSNLYSWTSLSVGEYFIKINPNDLSLEWAYQMSGANYDTYVGTSSNSKSMYRYVIQELPNNNLAVSIRTPNGPELWEFTPNGSFVGIIDDANTDYNHSGSESYEYSRHFWKVIGGEIYHEFYDSVNDSNDNSGHWEKLSIPGYQHDTGGAWASSQLQVVAESDQDDLDTYHSYIADFWIDNGGMVRSQSFWISKSLSFYKKEYNQWQSHASGTFDYWFYSDGALIAVAPHKIYRVHYNEMFPNAEITLNQNSDGNIVDVKDDMIYRNGQWVSVKGESTIVVNTLPNIGDQPNTSWFNIPSGFNESHTEIKEARRVGDSGRLYFLVAAYQTNTVSIVQRVWVIPASMVSVHEQEVSGLSVYPNPVVDNLIVHADTDIDQINVYNISGQLIKSVHNAQRVSFAELPQGIYLVKIISDSAVSTQKIIKQ